MKAAALIELALGSLCAGAAAQMAMTGWSSWLVGTFVAAAYALMYRLPDDH